jgi:hypothetical protein
MFHLFHHHQPGLSFLPQRLNRGIYTLYTLYSNIYRDLCQCRASLIAWSKLWYVAAGLCEGLRPDQYGRSGAAHCCVWVILSSKGTGFRDGREREREPGTYSIPTLDIRRRAEQSTCFRTPSRPRLYFCSFQVHLRVLKWGPSFSTRGGVWLLLSRTAGLTQRENDNDYESYIW